MRRLLAISALALALSPGAPAQCVMCYRTAHAQQAERARVLNSGIFVLGIPPFLMLAGFAIYLIRRGDD
jgi:hypothetical protein